MTKALIKLKPYFVNCIEAGYKVLELWSNESRSKNLELAINFINNEK